MHSKWFGYWIGYLQGGLKTVGDPICLQIIRFSFPLAIMWCRAPGASIRDCLAYARNDKTKNIFQVKMWRTSPITVIDTVCRCGRIRPFGPRRLFGEVSLSFNSLWKRLEMCISFSHRISHQLLFSNMALVFFSRSLQKLLQSRTISLIGNFE